MHGRFREVPSPAFRARCLRQGRAAVPAPRAAAHILDKPPRFRRCYTATLEIATELLSSSVSRYGRNPSGQAEGGRAQEERNRSLIVPERNEGAGHGVLESVGHVDQRS